MEKDLIIKKSKNGKGIFTLKGFIPGDIIFEVKGRFITCDEDENLDEKTRSNSYRFDKDKYLSPEGEIGDFLNHSCQPNSFIKKIKNKLYAIAIKNILPKSEVTFDYSTILADDDFWEMKCNCGEENCRGIIKQFITLDQNTRNKYLLSGIVPNYIYE